MCTCCCETESILRKDIYQLGLEIGRATAKVDEAESNYKPVVQKQYLKCNRCFHDHLCTCVPHCYSCISCPSHYCPDPSCFNARVDYLDCKLNSLESSINGLHDSIERMDRKLLDLKDYNNSTITFFF